MDTGADKWYVRPVKICLGVGNGLQRSALASGTICKELLSHWEQQADSMATDLIVIALSLRCGKDRRKVVVRARYLQASIMIYRLCEGLIGPKRDKKGEQEVLFLMDSELENVYDIKRDFIGPLIPWIRIWRGGGGRKMNVLLALLPMRVV